MDGRTRPWTVKIGPVSIGIQNLRDLALRPPLVDEHRVHALDDPLLFLGAGHQDHSVGLQALLLATGQLALRAAVLVDQNPPQPVSGGAALAIAKLHEAALPGEDLHRQLAAVFARHHALDGFQEVRADAAVVLELLAAVVDPDAGTGTYVLVVGAFVGILKPAPTADVVDEDGLEVGPA